MPQTACNCHGEQYCLNPFTATREISKTSRGHCETDYIDSNLPDNSGDGLEWRCS